MRFCLGSWVIFAVGKYLSVRGWYVRIGSLCLSSVEGDTYTKAGLYLFRGKDNFDYVQTKNRILTLAKS